MTSNADAGRYAHGDSVSGNAAGGTKTNGINWGPIADIWRRLKALWSIMMDRDASMRSRVIAGFALAYLISPFEGLGIPDSVPFLIGYLDDTLVVALAIRLLGDDLKKHLTSSNA